MLPTQLYFPREPRYAGHRPITALERTMRSFVAAVLLFASPLLAAEPKVRRDVAYVEPKTERRTLDLYSPASGSDHPIVVWIHGGGWRQGDKRGVQQKPQAFVDKGFVFVSINYRF